MKSYKSLINIEPHDLLGLGKATRSIPPEAWTKAANLVTESLGALLSPLTEAGSGAGRLIRQKFDRLTEMEKLFAAKAIGDVRKRIEESGKPLTLKLNPTVIFECLQGAGNAIEADMQAIWANLLAKEITDGGIHPEIPRILARMTAADAKRLCEIPRDWPATWMLIPDLAGSEQSFSAEPSPTRRDFSTSLLKSLGLVSDSSTKGFHLSALGKAFLEAVSDPVSSHDS